tara:strand:+ start:1923 stop:2243 length:321 start_codon:yes stop_codon:yes gene_type:complete
MSQSNAGYDKQSSHFLYFDAPEIQALPPETIALDFLIQNGWCRFHTSLRYKLIEEFNLKYMIDVLNLTRGQIFSQEWLQDAPKHNLWKIIQEESARQKIRNWQSDT